MRSTAIFSKLNCFSDLRFLNCCWSDFKCNVYLSTVLRSIYVNRLFILGLRHFIPSSYFVKLVILKPNHYYHSLIIIAPKIWVNWIYSLEGQGYPAQIEVVIRTCISVKTNYLPSLFYACPMHVTYVINIAEIYPIIIPN